MPFIKKPVSFIKIDVEGHEIDLLLGAKEIIAKYKPIIEIEIWDIMYDKFINRCNRSINYYIRYIDI
jgi:hypothetical protein